MRACVWNPVERALLYAGGRTQATAYNFSFNATREKNTPVALSNFAQVAKSTTVTTIESPPTAKSIPGRSFDGGMRELTSLPWLFGCCIVPAYDVIQSVRFEFVTINAVCSTLGAMSYCVSDLA